MHTPRKKRLARRTKRTARRTKSVVNNKRRRTEESCSENIVPCRNADDFEQNWCVTQMALEKVCFLRDIPIEIEAKIFKMAYSFYLWENSKKLERDKRVVVRTYYDKSVLRTERYYMENNPYISTINPHIHWIERNWHNNGRQSYQCDWVQGTMTGLIQKWHKNGRISCQGQCIDMKWNGVVREWHDTGILRCRRFQKNGEDHGQQKFFYPSGKLSVAVFSIEGTRLSQWTYDEHGNVTQQWTYEEGEHTGITTRWYKNGMVKCVLKFKQNKNHGFEEGWHADGSKHYEHTWKNGKREGLETTWDKNGTVVHNVLWRNGKKIGQERGWCHCNGNLLYENRWSNHQKHNLCKTFYHTHNQPGTSLWTEEYWHRGKIHGKRKTYYSDGQVRSESFWKYGTHTGPRKGDVSATGLTYEEPAGIHRSPLDDSIVQK